MCSATIAPSACRKLHWDGHRRHEGSARSRERLLSTLERYTACRRHQAAAFTSDHPDSANQKLRHALKRRVGALRIDLHQRRTPSPLIETTGHVGLHLWMRG